MPPVNPQANRSGLVAAVVAFTVLFVAATIFAIYYGVQDSKAEEALALKTSQFREIALDINSPDVSQLRVLAKSDPKLLEQTALAECLRQRNDLRDLIVGSAATPAGQSADVATQSDIADTMARVQQAMATANSAMGRPSQPTPDSLLGALAESERVIRDLDKAIADAHSGQTEAQAQAAKDSQAARDAQTKAEAAIDLGKAQLQQQLDAANDAAKKMDDEVQAVKKTFDDEQRETAATLDATDKQRVDEANQLDKLTKDMSLLTAELAGKRIDVTDPIVRRAQGQIVTIADAHTVYINLGQHDQIIPGMTFEVYDKTQPLPKLGSGLAEDNQPVGKASIEVVRVLPDGSECHVSHVEPGQQMVQGDPILNLVYNRNVKFNFYVFGQFDVGEGERSAASSGPVVAGGDVIRALIVQWGGRIDPTLDTQTDFVVVGTPPEVPVYTSDELKDPLNAQNLANARRDADQYDKVIQEAEDLHIPIMNQERFLYFTGYYDLASR